MTLKEYPAQLSLTTLICMMGALQGTVVTMVIENAKSGIWSMHKETELVATLYSVRFSFVSFRVLQFIINVNKSLTFMFMMHRE